MYVHIYIYVNIYIYIERAFSANEPYNGSVDSFCK